VACSVLLLIRERSSRRNVELLPFTDSRPAWDGSFPNLAISLTDVSSGHAKFNSSIRLIKPTVRHDSPINEFEVDLHSGMFALRQTDIFVADVMPLSLTRTYRVWSLWQTAFGIGANQPYDICPRGDSFPYTYLTLNLEDGWPVYFPRISKGTGYADAVYRHDHTASEFYGAQIAWNGNGWTLDFRDGRRFIFPESYKATTCAQGAPIAMQDATGHRIQLNRDEWRNLVQLVSPAGHTICLKYDGADRIIEAKDGSGNLRRYTYDSSGHLETVADASHVLYRFEYARLLHSRGYDPYLMTAVIDGRGTVLLRNTYKEGAVSEQRLSNGDRYKYDYRRSNNEIVETIVTTPTGTRRFFFQRGILSGEQ
jgi:YD repeat-containing protein